MGVRTIAKMGGGVPCVLKGTQQGTHPNRAAGKRSQRSASIRGMSQVEGSMVFRTASTRWLAKGANQHITSGPQVENAATQLKLGVQK